MKKNSEIHIRDPFILPVAKEQRYYMYGTTDPNPWSEKGLGFDAYYSSDLSQWEGPFPVFRPSENFWAEANFWAPEVHYYRGAYYMFASFKSKNRARGTQVLVAEHPTGPFSPISSYPVTPKDWECLDGTLYLEDGMPYLVFCREWVQVTDGQICSLPLSKDLTKAIGEPQIMWQASQSGWATPIETNTGKTGALVTDGPFLYTNQDGELLCIWSSFYNNAYAIGLAKSTDSTLSGQWIHQKTPFFHQDGGHGMIFTTFDERLMLSLHQPNRLTYERPHFFEVAEQDGWLVLRK